MNMGGARLGPSDAEPKPRPFRDIPEVAQEPDEPTNPVHATSIWPGSSVPQAGLIARTGVNVGSSTAL